MPRRPSEYRRPADLATARALLRRSGPLTAPLLIGPRPQPHTFLSADTVVDLRGLGLEHIAEHAGRVTIGGQASLQAILESDLLNAIAGGILPEAAALAAHLGLRHLATLHGALSAPEGPPELRLALLALNAALLLETDERQIVSLAAYEPDARDLLLEAAFDKPPAAGGAIARVARSPLDSAIASAVAVVTESSARVAVAGASAAPLAWSLAGGPFTEDDFTQLADAITLAAGPIGDYRGSAEYRKAMAGVLAHRALTQAWKQL